MANLYETIETLCRLNEIDVTYMCRESGASRGSMTDLKKNRISTLTTGTLDKIARYFHVTVDFLLDENDDKWRLLGGGGQNKNPDPEWDGIYHDVISDIVGLTPDQVQEVADYIAFVKSRGAK